MTAALKLRTIVENAEHVIAIELLAAAEGLEFRRPLKGGAGVEQAYDRVRSISQAVDADRSMSPDIAQVAAAIREGVFDSDTETI
jgi:histidine ammonia-lyase